MCVPSHLFVVLCRIYFVTKVNFTIQFTVFLFCLAATARAQVIDNSSTFRKINREKYFRFHYDNDYFTKSDEYYTQGVAFEYVHPRINKFFPARLLWKPYKADPQTGIALNLFAFSPTSTRSNDILYGDRPFDANISLRVFSIQNDSAHQRQVSAAFTIGVMGPAALGNEIHTAIHRWLKNPLPYGWQHQVQNDVIINYQLNYEKNLFRAGSNFSLNTTGEARLGTLNTKVSGGFNVMAGRFNKRFSSVNHHPVKTEYYFYAQSRLNLIGYDATLQGGLFNQKSPYTIAAADVSRVTFQADAGVIVNFKSLFLSYTQSFLTKEFTTGNYHRWGGISAGFAF